MKKRKMVGSVTPSSKYLSRKMISRVDWSKAKCIVELGPGNGCITKEIIERMGPDTQLLTFEMNEAFVEQYLQFDDDRVHVICDSAEFIGKYLEEHGFEQVDYIISSLPLTNFPPELKEKIIDESVRVLRPGGIYMQYQYVTTVARLLRRKFKKVKIRFAPYNLPPAFVYTCYN
ncbi:MAG: methyltransferase domain-containing protein [Bacteroidota bacterium]